MNRIIISDTSPLNYLILLEAVDSLSKVTDQVIIPPSVAQELSSQSASINVRNWINNPPLWLKILVPQHVDYALGLDEGESEAIALAQELKITSILIDERKGAEIAASLGLKPLGLIGLLVILANQGMINFEEFILRLKATNFRLSDSLIEAAKKLII